MYQNVFGRKPENPKETHTDKSGENTKIQTDRIQGLSYEMWGFPFKNAKISQEPLKNT